MRVISGSKRGLKLQTPIGDGTRPTEDRVKENIFNILGQMFYDVKVMDLFSGTGQIGIEFLSRGAESVTFIEKDKKVLKVLKENLNKASFKAKILENDVLLALNSVGDKFDYIYMDPPYDDSELYYKVAEKVYKLDLLKENGILVVEERTENQHDFSEYFELIRNKKYGSTTIELWRKR
ncbi:MAG: 16S rRNA (guanine(966)-N(2))-methyltransferase RsmD [Peptoniphilus sp.]|uniref:16S rRNA (guanine(966)-N(2))-methyltransferase RsmD n=1 Tax=Peptoniphilus sp. TaxID=1971214 RepID=UPI002A76390C|nr:16S rRNA (guanine(966)-N(2))-methyltransferase RsmD [Peptoniphilus sp.]MDY2987204.1 16S rRNA (guanine(966)-N(2))-methyltransferase RsmD [Peptoniphilus sp.]